MKSGSGQVVAGRKGSLLDPTLAIQEPDGTVWKTPRPPQHGRIWRLEVEDTGWGSHWRINGKPVLTWLEDGIFPAALVPEQVVNLVLAGFEAFPDCHQLPGFLAGLPALESLMIHQFAYLDDIRALPYCASLRHLTLCTERLRSLRILEGCGNLRTLRLAGCFCLRNLDGLESLENLERLEVMHCPSLHDLGALGKCRNLRQLALVNCGVSNLSPLAGAEGLETLVLSNLGHLGKVTPMGPKPLLRELSIHDCPKVANLNCLRDMRELRHCSLQGFRGRRVQPVFSLPELRSLDLASCTLEDRDLLPLLRLPRLEALALTGALDVQHLYHVEGLLNLRRLELQGCINLTTLRFLRHLQRLETLDLTLCLQAGPLDLLNRLESLRRLGISAISPAVMDPGFLRSMPGLRDLRMAGWYRLRDLRCLGDNTQLESLDIRGCHLLADLRQLEGLPGLYSLKCDAPHLERMAGGLDRLKAFANTEPGNLHPLIIQRTDLGRETLWPCLPDPRIDMSQYRLIQGSVINFLRVSRRPAGLDPAPAGEPVAAAKPGTVSAGAPTAGTGIG